MASDSFMASFDFGGLVETRPPSRSHQRRPSQTPPRLQPQPQPQPQPTASELPNYNQENEPVAESENQPEETLQTQEYLDSNNESLFTDYHLPWERSKETNEALFEEARWMKDKKAEIAAERKELSWLQKTLATLNGTASELASLVTDKSSQSYLKPGDGLGRLSDIDRVMKEQQDLSDIDRILKEQQDQSLRNNFTLDDKVPRLFVVLPWEKESWDLNDFSTHTFKLYFFCEYGDYSEMPNKQILHNIHVAKHSGYNILEPLEFFKRFGAYTLIVMEMLQREMVARRVIVPTQGYLNNLDAIRDYIEGFEFSNKTFALMVEESMQYIKTHVKSSVDSELQSGAGDEWAELMSKDTYNRREKKTGSMKAKGGDYNPFSVLSRSEETLANYDLTGLPAFLENGQEEIKRLGNMFRTSAYNDDQSKGLLSLLEKGQEEIERLGNISKTVAYNDNLFKEVPRYVCMDHYLEHYRAHAIDLVDEFVTDAGGTLDREQGTVDVTFTSSAPAEQFYGAFYRASSLCILRLRLEWEVSSYDMSIVLSAILQSSIAVVEIDGSVFESSLRPGFARQLSRYDPLLQLLVHSSLSTLSVTNCPAFLTRISELKDEGPLRKTVLGFKGESRATVIEQQAVIRVLNYLSPDIIKGKNLDIEEAGTLLVQWDRNKGDIRVSSMALTTDLFKTDANLKGKGRALASASATRSVLVKDAQLTAEMVTSGGLSRITIQNVSKKTLPFVSKVLAINPTLPEIFAEVRESEILTEMDFYDQQSLHNTAPLKVTFLERPREGEEKAVATVVFHPQDSGASHQPSHGHNQRRVKILDWKYDYIDGPMTNRQAVLLDIATQQHPSVLFSMSLDVSLLRKLGLARVGSTLTRSSIVFLKMYCFPMKQGQVSAIQKVLSAVNWSKVKSLTLFGSAIEQWMALLANAMCASPCILQEFGINVYNPVLTLSHAGAKWIHTMMTRHPLTALRLSNIHMTEPDWQIIVGGLDFARLETFDISLSNFGKAVSLLDAITSESASSSLPLKVLNLQSTLWLRNTGVDEWRAFLLAITQEIPSITVLV
ncbi:hypothetical protein CPC16_000668 [Podila verticillata]|nr:hypothetical protein BGZ59_003258 [Podila verticillata]KAF9375553.1 hypothetical protein CPC16_000668 [Podila verticillata]